jgi:hypothetical protein
MNSTNAYSACISMLGSNITDRQLIECITITENAQRDILIRNVALVFAGFIVFVMQVCFGIDLYNLSICDS